jgi:hypothetical protein
MFKGLQWLALLAGGLALAACDSGGVSTVRLKGGSNYSAGAYVQSGAENGTNAVVVHNSPFPPEAVLAALRARYQSNQYRFALGTPTDWNGYTVVIGFGLPPVGSQNLCANPDLPQAPAPAGVTALVANYCYGNRLVTEALGRVGGVTGPDDPRFRDLIGQTVAELFASDEYADLGGIGFRPLP